MATSLTILQTLKSLRSFKPLASLAEWHANSMGYRKMGLRFDDLIPEENTIVQEALRRLTPREYGDRLYRLRRALALSTKKETLSKEEWLSAQEVLSLAHSQDTPYLRPIIEQVELEVATRQNFDNLSVIPEALAKRNRL